MKVLILSGLIAGLISLPLTSVAQNNDNPFPSDSTKTSTQNTQNETSQSNMEHGDWALMFQIDKNFTLKDFSGTLISFQRTLSNRNAIRWGLNLDGGYSEQKNNPTQKTTTGNFHIGVSMDYLWYAHVSHDIRFYYGLGPIVGFGYDHTKNSQNSGVNVTKQTTVSEQIGLNGVAGVEWFVKPRISLVAEYVPALTGQYQSKVNKIINTNADTSIRTKTSSTDIHLGSMPVRFGVSVYF